MECFHCSALGENVRLFDGISAEGIVKVCEDCSIRESVPLIKKPTTFQLKESEKKITEVYHIHTKEELENKKRMQLKDLIEMKSENKKNLQLEPRPDLVEHFHWVIMKSRRTKKISQKQLAKEIGEAEATIDMAERGVLPEDDYRVVRKLERYLGIKLVRDEYEDIVNRMDLDKKTPARILNFDPKTAETLTIADLQEMKKTKEESLGEDVSLSVKGEKIELNSDEPEIVEKINEIEKKTDKELSDNDINNLIFGR